GAIHIHTQHSDGSGYLPEIAEAAKANNLDFLLITDHNTLALKDSAANSANPVVIIGTELSVGAGHLLAYGLQSLPEKFSEAKMGGLDTILDSIRAHNGFAIVAHPIHPKIPWKADTISPKIDGLEILNADVEWRNDNPFAVLMAFLAYPFFDHAMNYLLDSPQHELDFWDRLLQKRQAAGIGSVDAHVRIKLGSGRYWRFPSYTKTFSLVQNAVMLRDSLSSHSEIAKQQIVHAIRNGNLLFGFASLGKLGNAKIWYEDDNMVYLPGEKISFQSGRGLIKIRLPGSMPLETHLYQNGNLIASSNKVNIDWEVKKKGVYRVIVFQRRLQFPFLSRKFVPWVFSNPFYLVH
ncbi:MAG: PHP domain-containing protein, partial [bacterium]